MNFNIDNKMKKLNFIGLEKEKSDKLAGMLNDLLANYQVFYMNVRGFHWNIKGEKFFELHVKFEELYDDLVIKIDEIAERITTLGATPLHTFEDYLKTSEIKSVKDAADPMTTVQSILESFRILLVKEREILDLSDELGDEGTNALASDYIREKEKLAWMYNSFLN